MGLMVDAGRNVLLLFLLAVLHIACFWLVDDDTLTIYYFFLLLSI